MRMEFKRLLYKKTSKFIIHLGEHYFEIYKTYFKIIIKNIHETYFTLNN